VLNDGIRLQAVRLRSTIKDNSFFNFPFSNISQNNTAVTGNIGLVFLVNKNARLNGGFSTGFRAPNIDDLARIFETSTKDRRLIVPNPDIKPEYTYNFDLNYSQWLSDKLKIEAGGFYTLFRNAIAVAPFQLNGEDSVNYNGTMSRVFANRNVNRAFLYGFNASVTIGFTRALQFYSTATYTYGRQQPAESATVPLDHILPFFGKTSLEYSESRFSAAVYAMYNGWKKIEDYNPFGEDNAQYATPKGMPSWMTLNIRGSVKVFKQLELQAAIENIFDRNYRYFASGFSAPGRNLVIAVRSNF
jgi:hemoglobin/transferrin/lactoferrin receptor protein